MKLILLQDVENLGKKRDIVEVKDGFARNFLIPKGLAKAATEGALKELEAHKEIMKKAEEESLRLTQALASSLEGIEIEIKEKTEQGQLFGSVTAAKIANKLKNLGYDIKASNIKIKDPIKITGVHKVLIELDHGLESEITVNVVSND